MKPRWFHDALIGGVLILMQGAILAPFADEANAEDSWPVIFSVCYAVVGGALVWRWPRQGWDLGRYLLVALIALAFVSASWSPTPELVMRRSVALTGTMLFALYLATTMDWRRFVRVLFWSCAVIVVSCYLFAAFHPTWNDAQDSRGEFWRGAFIHRNSLGRFCVFSALVSVMAIRAGVNLKVTMASVAATVFLGVKSGSMTALGVAMVVAFATAILWPVPARTPSIHWRRISITVGAMLSILVCLLFWSEVLMAQVQRETTLTGRTDLWRLLWFEYRGQLLVGSGFSSFWSDLEGTARQVSAALDWAPPHAHNGYLDLMLDLGLGGLIIMLSYLFLSLRASVDSQAVLVFHLYLVFFLAYNFTESAMLRQNNIFFVVMIVLSEQMRLLRVPVPDSAGRTGTTA